MQYRSGRGLTFLIAGWGCAVLLGMGLIVRYQSGPASSNAAIGGAAVNARWPAGLHIQPDALRATLIMTLHPRCPCSRASVRELAVLMARAGDRVATTVLMVQPAGAPAEWLDTDLRRAAAAIPGVNIVNDQNGADAATLGANTSGHVTLYDVQGRLLFSGGITEGRGHEGDNAGLDAVLRLTRGEALSSTTPSPTGTAQTPVYGCPLHGRGADCFVTPRAATGPSGNGASSSEGA